MRRGHKWGLPKSKITQIPFYDRDFSGLEIRSLWLLGGIPAKILSKALSFDAKNNSKGLLETIRRHCLARE
jgi:hypothetical protein